jgi:hypothetical protein
VTATLEQGATVLVLDGRVVVGGSLKIGPLDDGSGIFLDGNAVAGMGGYPAEYYRALENATGLLGLEHIEPGGEHGVLYVSSGLPTWGLIMDANVSAVAAIAGSKIEELNDIPGTLDASKLFGEGTVELFHVTDTLEAFDLTVSNAFEANTGTFSNPVHFTASSPLAPFSVTSAVLVANLNAAKVSGNTASDLLSRANHTGTQLAATISDFSAAVAATPPAAHVHAAADVTSGQLALARGGTAVDNSSQTANLGFFSPASGGAGAMSVRAMVPADVPALDTAKIASGQFALAQMPRAAAGKVIRGAGTGADPAYSTLTVPDTVADQDLLVATASNTVGVVTKPGATSVLTHTGSAYAWAAALAKAQQHAQTAYLDGTAGFSAAQQFLANIGQGSSLDYGGGVMVLYQRNATTAPTSDPSSGYVQYSSGGIPNFRCSTGRIIDLSKLAFPKRLTADVALSASTNISVSGLDVAMAANEAWLVDYEIHASVTGGTAGLKPFFTSFPSGATGTIWIEGQTANAATYDHSAPSTNPGNAGATGYITASFDGAIRVRAAVVNGANAGNIRIAFTTGPSAAGNIKANSHVMAMRSTP